MDYLDYHELYRHGIKGQKWGIHHAIATVAAAAAFYVANKPVIDPMSRKMGLNV